MASQQEIKEIASRLMAFRLGDVMRYLDANAAGSGAVLCYLAGQEGPVTSGEIASSIRVTTARTAVLLQKMEAAGLILRNHSPQDRRVTVVSLTEQGMAEYEKRTGMLQDALGGIIDAMGMERVRQLVSLCQEAGEVLNGMNLCVEQAYLNTNGTELRKGIAEE